MSSLCPPLIAILVGAATCIASASPTFKEKLVRKLSPPKYEKLKSLGLLKTVENTEKGEIPCAHSNAFTTFEKSLFSDLVIVGKVIKSEYLYREGGPFRTEFEIEVKEVLSGDWRGEKVQVLSHYGPNTRDHRRWRANIHQFELEQGDEAIFFLETEPLKELARKFPVKESWLQGKFVFLQDDVAGTLILDPKTNGQNLDATYLQATQRKNHPIPAHETRRAILNASFYLRER